MWNLVIHWLEKGVVETPKEMVIMMKKILCIFIIYFDRGNSVL